MTLQPCLECGAPTDGRRCPEHAPTPPPRARRPWIRENPAPWKRRSQQLRSQQPFCSFCGSREDLTVDHILPIDTHPELTWDKTNLQVLCRSCNSRKGTGGDPQRSKLPPHAKPKCALLTVTDSEEES